MMLVIGLYCVFSVLWIVSSTQMMMIGLSFFVDKMLMEAKEIMRTTSELLFVALRFIKLLVWSKFWTAQYMIE